MFCALLFHSLREPLFVFLLSFFLKFLFVTCTTEENPSEVSSNRPRGCVYLYFILRPSQPDHIFRIKPCMLHLCGYTSGPSDWEVIKLFLWQSGVNINPPTLQWHGMVGVQLLATWTNSVSCFHAVAEVWPWHAFAVCCCQTQSRPLCLCCDQYATVFMSLASRKRPLGLP